MKLIKSFIIFLLIFVFYTFFIAFTELKKDITVKFSDGPYTLKWRILLYTNGRLFCKGAGLGIWQDEWKLIERHVDNFWATAIVKGPVIVYTTKGNLRWKIINTYTGKPYFSGFLYPLEKLPHHLTIIFDNYNTGSVISIYNKENNELVLKVNVDIWGNKEYLYTTDKQKNTK